MEIEEAEKSFKTFFLGTVVISILSLVFFVGIVLWAGSCAVDYMNQQNCQEMTDTVEEYEKCMERQ